MVLDRPFGRCSDYGNNLAGPVVSTYLSMNYLTLVIFLVCYALISYFMNRQKHVFALLSAYLGVAVLLLISAITFPQALSSININVLGVFLGTMILSSLFIFSGVPAYLACLLVDKSKSICMAMLLVCGLSGFISSFTENVATVLIVAPIALEIARAIKINPVPLLIGVALSANLQGTATMIGDSPSIILAMQSGMNFNDFFWMLKRPGIFFAVELGAVGAFLVLWLIFKKYKQPPHKIEIIRPKTWIPALLMSLMVFSLVISSFIKNKPQYSVAFICLSWALIGLVWHELKHRESISLVRNLDWQTFFFLIGIFILVGSLTYNGIIDDIAKYISSFTGQNAFFAYLLIVWMSVFISAFVDNIPYTIAMIPVAKIVAANLGMSMYPFLFGLLIGTCLGGNITPIGASCNVVTIGILRKQGYRVKFSDFVKIGLPFTLIAVLLGSLFIWAAWR
jgi:Na+/H+ antiporter NhaD/arsenite permease-like protein